MVDTKLGALPTGFVEQRDHVLWIQEAHSSELGSWCCASSIRSWHLVDASRSLRHLLHLLCAEVVLVGLFVNVVICAEGHAEFINAGRSHIQISNFYTSVRHDPRDDIFRLRC